MTTRFVGAPVPRNEDPRLLTGRALFGAVDEIALSLVLSPSPRQDLADGIAELLLGALGARVADSGQSR